MRAFLVALAAFALAASAAAHQQTTLGGNHSPSVMSFSWNPDDPLRGQPVSVGAALYPSIQATTVVLTYCRATEYACAPAIELVQSQGGWVGEIPATTQSEKFLQRTTWVGLNLTIKHQNGTIERSPLADWPARPLELPQEAGYYYWYQLPPPETSKADTPGPALAAVLGLLALATFGARRRLRR